MLYCVQLVSRLCGQIFARLVISQLGDGLGSEVEVDSITLAAQLPNASHG